MLSSNHIWLVDFHLAAFGLLAVALAVGSLIRQPTKRLMIAWGTTLNLALLLGFATIPGWASWSLARQQTGSVASATESSSQRIEKSVPIREEVPAPPLTGFTAKQMPEESFPVLPTSKTTRIDPLQEVAKLVLHLNVAGTTLATGWLLIGWWLARRLVGSAIEANVATRQLVETLTDTPPKLLVSNRLAGPVAIGLVHPTILLPQRLVERSDTTELRTVLAHELAHVQNGDLWLLAGLRLMLILLWCNPLYWMLRHRVRLDQETLADAAAADQSDRHAYANRLVGWAKEMTLGPRVSGAAGLWESPSQLRKRIVVLLDDGFTVLRESSLRWRVCCGILSLMLSVAASLVTLGPAEATEQENAGIGQETEGETEAASNATNWNPKQVMEFHAVHAETGEDLAGVSLELQNAGPGIDFEDIPNYTTDERGRAQIKLSTKPPTAVRLYPSKSGFVPLRVYWEREPHPVMPDSVTVQMQPGLAFGGRVKNEAGEPIKGVTVRVHYWGKGVGENPHIRANFNDETTKTTTDGEGRWRFDLMPDDLDPQELRIYFHHPDFISDHHQRAYIPKPVIKQPPLSDLYDQTAIVTMRAGFTLEGRVVDTNGRPIANANIYDRERRGWPGGEAQAISDAEGWFKITREPANAFDRNPDYRHLPRQKQPDALTLTVQASGFAAELVEVDQLEEKLEIKLSRGKAIEGRVTDSQGEPIVGTNVIPRSWRGYTARLYLNVATDKDGRFRLDGVPLDEVEYDFFKKKYVGVQGFAMKPSLGNGEFAYQITLRQPVTIRGVVTDGDTGQPIRDFTLHRGIDYEDGRAPSWMLWQRRDLTTGEYETELTQTGLSFRLRIDADGYMPGESRIFRAYDPDEGELNYNFKLRRAERLVGTALDLAGRPLANATVHRARSRLNVRGRKVNYVDEFDQPPAVTDSAGRFSFPPEIEPYCVVIAHPDGIGLATEQELEQSVPIQLKPWKEENEQLQIIRRPSVGVLVDFPNPSPTSRLRN